MRNTRLKRELGVRLRYARVVDCLQQLRTVGAN
jgi:hypothetical protein